MCISFGNPSDPCCDDGPPSHSIGRIMRFIRPRQIDDYAGISTHGWTLLESGARRGLEENEAQDNKLCLCHEVVNSNVLNPASAQIHIMAPLRYEIAAPSSDGKQYDFFESLEGVAGYSASDFTHSSAYAHASDAISNLLLPNNSHCRFAGGLVEPYRYALPFLTLAEGDPFFTTYEGGYSTRFRHLGFQAISPGVNMLPGFPLLFEPATPFTSIYAFRIVVNDEPTGPLRLWANASDQERADMNLKVRIRSGDRYAVDVWHRIAIDLNFPTEWGEEMGGIWGTETNYTIMRGVLTGQPLKMLAYIPLSLVSSGRQYGELLLLDNVDFAPRFNASTQAFEFSIGGHRGWTLNSEGNGPEKMISSAASAYWTGPGEGYIEQISLEFGREIADLILLPGDALRAMHPEIIGAILYRPTLPPQENHYRRKTESTDFGTIFHAPCGPFVQDGLTIFKLVPWTVSSGVSDIDGHSQLAVGSTSEVGPKLRGVPKTIAIRRVNK